MIAVVVVGAGGRMGKLLVAKLLRGVAGMELAGAVVRMGSDLVGQSVATLLDDKKLVSSLLMGDDLATMLRGLSGKKKLIIDFSSADNALPHATLSAEAGVPFLLGTTGLGEQVTNAIKSLANKIPILITQNTSFGVMVLKKLAQQATEWLGDDTSITIREAHHIHKKDKPSGTALMLGRAMDEITKNAINYESVREGEIIGRHEIIFDGTADTITLIHEAKDRILFADGALRAGRWLCQKPAGYYTMGDTMGDNDEK